MNASPLPRRFFDANSTLPRKTILVLALFFLMISAALAQVIPPPGLVIGSANTATADPPVARPDTTPCEVTLFSNFTFADFSPKPFSFTPPSACPGPWAKVVLEADFSIQAGRQFDRTANIWIGGTNVYFGTTSEPSRTVARSWHIERDLTDYGSLFRSPQAGRVDLGNLVNSTFTSSLFGTATLQFYPEGKKARAPETADMVLPLSGGPTGGSVDLGTTADKLARTFTLPANVERAYLDVIAQSQANDEFWYTCVPDDLTSELQSCGSTSFRETEVAIDGQPAGVAPVYPWIYTGGIDPLLWRPIPGVQTLNFAPYRVDLTPFAAVLSDGNPHEVALNVFNADQHFSTTATLLVFQDHESAQITGAVTRNSIGAPAPEVTRNIAVNGNNITGNVTVTSARTFEVEGFVRTSHGRVRTRVEQTIHFTSSQDFNISDVLFDQDIHQGTTISSKTSTRGGDGEKTVLLREDWPLHLDFQFVVNPDGSAAQTTTIDQAFNSSQATSGDDGDSQFSVVSNRVTPVDTLIFNTDGSVTAGPGQASAQTYFSQDSKGNCFSRTIKAAGGVLTSVEEGCRK